MGIEGLWSVVFGTPVGAVGAGVVVFETQRIFGGDSGYYYLGDYQVNGNTFGGSVAVIHHAGPLNNIFGPVQRVDLRFQGTMGGATMDAVGIDPNNPQRRVGMQFRRLADLP